MDTKQSVIELLIRLRDSITGPMAKVTTAVHGFEKQMKEMEETSKSFKSVAISGAVFLGMAYEVKEGIEKLVEPAMAFAHVQNDLQRATGASTGRMREFAEQAHHLADTLPLFAEDVTQAQSTLAKTLGSTQASLDAMSATAQFATATNMSANDAATLLGSAYETLGDKSKPLKVGYQQIADKLALLQSHYSTSAVGGDELARSFAHVAEASAAFGVSVDQSAALLGVLNKAGLGGGRGAGTYAQELITQLGKLGKDGIPQIQRYGVALARNANGGVDLVRTIENLRSVSQAQASAYIKSLGTSGQALALLYQHYGDLKAAVLDFGNAAGTAGKLATLASMDPAAKFKMFQSTVEQLRESMGNALLPVLISVADALKPIIEGFSRFAEAHPTLIKIALVTATVLATTLALSGAFLILVAGLGEIIHMVELARASFALLRMIMLTMNFTILLNPIGLVIAAIAALSVAGYEVYQHWDAVKRFFTTGWGRFTGLAQIVEAVMDLFKLLPAVYHWGVSLIENIVKGIKAGVGKVKDAMHGVTKAIRAYLPFSPAEVGPLRDINRVRIVETIAQTLKPQPMLSAMKNVALAAATVPLLGMPTFAAANIAHNGVAGASGGGTAAGGDSGGVHFHVHIEGTATASAKRLADQVLDALRQNEAAFVNLVREATDQSDRTWDRTRL